MELRTTTKRSRAAPDADALDRVVREKLLAAFAAAISELNGARLRTFGLDVTTLIRRVLVIGERDEQNVPGAF